MLSYGTRDRKEERRQWVSTLPFYTWNLIPHSNKSPYRAFSGFISRRNRPSQDRDGKRQGNKLYLRWVDQAFEKTLNQFSQFTQVALGWCQGSRLLSKNVELSQDPNKQQLCLQGEMCLAKLTAEKGGLGKVSTDCCWCHAGQAETRVSPKDGQGRHNLMAGILSCYHWTVAIIIIPQTRSTHT